MVNMPGVESMINTNGLAPLSRRELSAQITTSQGYLNWNFDDNVYLEAVLPLFLDGLSGAERRERPPAPSNFLGTSLGTMKQTPDDPLD